MQDVHKLIDRQTIFELAAPPSYKVFLQILMVQHLSVYFNWFLASKIVRLA